MFHVTPSSGAPVAYADGQLAIIGRGTGGMVIADQEGGHVTKVMPYSSSSRHEVAVQAVLSLLSPRSPCFIPIHRTWHCAGATCDDSPVPDNSHCVQMPRVAHGTLRQFVIAHHHKRHFETRMRSLLFQLLHGLHVAQETLRLTHWDLHPENVLVGTFASRQRTVYLGADERYVVPTYGVCPRLCDYGFASVEPARGLLLAKEYTNAERVALVSADNVASFCPFVQGYDQTVLGAYVLDLLMNDEVLGLTESEKGSFMNGLPVDKVQQCGFPQLFSFLRDDVASVELMREAVAQDTLRPRSRCSFDAMVAEVSPDVALRSPFFQKYRSRRSA